MPRRWNWDFEPEQGPPAQASAQPQGTQEPDRAPIRRRRRALALAVAVGAVAIVAVALLGSHGRSSKAVSAAPGGGHRAALGGVARPRDDELEVKRAVSGVLAYTPFVRKGGDHGRDIALTFDDGPGPYTPEVLNVLERFHVRATFFSIGEMDRYFSASTVRELRDGDVVGDHTETHPEMAHLSAHDQHEELFEQIARIELLGGPRPSLFRPPYGSFNATTLRQLRALHLLMVLWSVDTDDYLQPGVSEIVENALAGAHPGAIVLMHDAGGDRLQTIAALPTIIRRLRARGFHLVTVPQLLADDPPPRGEPLPPNLSGD